VGYTYNILFLFKPNEQDDYEGAIVIPIVPGSHDVVSVLDFSSLYPSIMMTHAICPTSIVYNKNYLNLPGKTYSTISRETRYYGKYRKTDNIQLFRTKSLDCAFEIYCRSDRHIKDCMQKWTCQIHNKVVDYLQRNCKHIEVEYMNEMITIGKFFAFLRVVVVVVYEILCNHKMFLLIITTIIIF
jgi:DNA polymerase elongation subunit (family B)